MNEIPSSKNFKLLQELLLLTVRLSPLVMNRGEIWESKNENGSQCEIAASAYNRLVPTPSLVSTDRCKFLSHDIKTPSQYKEVINYQLCPYDRQKIDSEIIFHPSREINFVYINVVLSRN